MSEDCLTLSFYCPAHVFLFLIPGRTEVGILRCEWRIINDQRLCDKVAELLELEYSLSRGHDMWLLKLDVQTSSCQLSLPS